MKKLLIAILACAALFGLSLSPAAAAGKIPVIVASSTDTSPQNYCYLAYEKMVELANKYSDDAFDFQLYPSMQLGDEQETVRALQLGTVNISILATNNFAPFAPSCGWVNMPYMFDTLEQFRGLVDAMWDQHNEWAVKESGAHVLSILDIGYRQLTTNAKHPVRCLNDAKGIKIRTPQNALMVSTFKALGLEPTALAFSETFNALQQGVIDGQECCFNIVTTLKYYEAQKYATEINYAVHSANFLASEKWLQTLPEKARNALIRAGREAMEYERTKVAGLIAADSEIMKKNGMELLGPVTDMPEWVRLGRTAWPKCYEVIGDGNGEKGKAIMDIVQAKAVALKK
jgi:tripartite ATP-independent transporter DctP family solute receptor